MSRRVVITGLGAVTGLGTGFYPTWERLVAGDSCLRPSTRVAPGSFACSLAGESDVSARDFVPKSYRKAVKVMARDTELAVAAASLAARDARLDTREAAPAPSYPNERLGCHIGAGLIAAESAELTVALASARAGPDRLFSIRAWGTEGPDSGGGMNNLQPLWMLKYLPNMLSCHVTIIHGAEGPSNTLTCAEASSLLCLGESTRVIQRGAADACFSGGAECKLCLVGLLHLTFAGRLAPTGDAPSGASVVRPYDPASPGTIPAEGGAILILEEQAAANARNAPIYAQISGFGAAQSGAPNIPPCHNPASNRGLVLAISRSLRDASISPADIDAIVPQAPGVPAIDLPEAASLREVFAARLASIPLVTLAPMLGDCIAGQGGLQAAVAAMCIREQRLPARLNAGSPLPGLDAGPAPSRPARLRHVLVCTSSLGGQNAALVLSALPS